MKISVDFVCTAIVKWSLYAIFFLTPIFFLPLTPYPVDISKQFVFMTLVLVATLAVLIKAVKRGEIEYVKDYAGIPLTALVIFTAVSAFFSGARHISFVGLNGGEVDTALAILGFTLFYFLISVSFREKGEARNAFIALMASGSIAVIYGLLQAAGVSFLPWDFAQGGNFNPVGNMSAFSLYVGCVAVLSFAVAYYMPVTRRMRLWAGILAGASFIFAALVGYWALFAALAVGFSLLAFMRVRSEGKKAPYGNFVPFAAITVVLCMLVITTGIVSIPVPRIASPTEIFPSVSASFRIAQATAQSGIKNFLLGSGPATYQYEYTRYHDATLNSTLFWNVQFTQGFNAILTHLVSWGIFGTAAFLLFLGIGFYRAFRLGKNPRADYMAATVAALFAYSAVTLIFYPQNFVLYFLVFAFAGMLAAFAAEGHRGYGVVSFSVPIVIMFAVVLVGGLVYVNGRRYVGAIRFGRGVRVASETKDMGKALPLLTAGSSLDPRNDAYLAILVSAYLARANTMAGAIVGTPDDEVRKSVADAISAAVAAAERATQINPRSAAHWIALAQAYEIAVPFNAGAAALIIPVYGKAASLDPINPAIPTYIGNAHVGAAARAESDKKTEYATAQASFERAIALKADYALAYFGLIRMFDIMGREADAIARADRLRATLSNNPETLFQLGVIHYEAGRIGKAQEVLQQTVGLVPNYANALYFLALAEEKLGDRPSALLKLERVLQLNPENKEVQAIIASLRTGKPAKK